MCWFPVNSGSEGVVFTNVKVRRMLFSHQSYVWKIDSRADQRLS